MIQERIMFTIRKYLYLWFVLLLFRNSSAQEFKIADGFYEWINVSPHTGLVYLHDFWGFNAYDVWEANIRTHQISLSKFRSFYPPIFAKSHNWAVYADSLNYIHIHNFLSDTEEILPKSLGNYARVKTRETPRFSFSPNDKYLLIMVNTSAFYHSMEDGTEGLIDSTGLVNPSDLSYSFDWTGNDSTLLLVKKYSDYYYTMFKYNFICKTADTLRVVSEEIMDLEYHPFAYNRTTNEVMYITGNKNTSRSYIHSYNTLTRKDSLLFSLYIQEQGNQGILADLSWSPDWQKVSFLSLGLEGLSNLHVYYPETNKLKTCFKSPKSTYGISELTWFGNDTLLYEIITQSLFGFDLYHFTDIRNQQQPVEIAGLTLLQNYPNPFNGMTQISFSVAERGSVSIDIFDVLGKKVFGTILENVSAGEHIYRWDPSLYGELPSGTYFVKLIYAGKNYNSNVKSIKTIYLK